MVEELEVEAQTMVVVIHQPHLELQILAAVAVVEVAKVVLVS